MVRVEERRLKIGLVEIEKLYWTDENHGIGTGRLNGRPVSIYFVMDGSKLRPIYLEYLDGGEKAMDILRNWLEKRKGRTTGRFVLERKVLEKNCSPGH